MASKTIIILNALAKKYPGNKIGVTGEEIVSWEGPNAKPGPVEVEQLYQQEVRAMAAVAYQEQRKAEYPSIADQLDAIWKGGADMEQMRQQVLAVKAKYPKPEK